MTKHAERKGVQSVEIAARILQALAAVGTFMPLKDVAAASDIDSSRAYTYLVSLVRTGLAEQDRDTGRYRLGPQMRRLGLAALNTLDVHRIARNAAVQLRISTEHTTAVAVWSAPGPVIVSWERGTHALPVNINIGSTLPVLGTAMGRIFLAYLPDKVTRDAVKSELPRLRLRNSFLRLRTAKDVRTLAASIRRDGLARIDGTLIPDMGAIAAPIFANDGQVVAAIGALGADIGTKDKHARAAERSLLSVTSNASEELGYVD